MGDTDVEIEVEGQLVEQTGNGAWESFTPETAVFAQRKSVEARKRNRAARQLAELEAYIDAHREHAQELLGAKLELISSLRVMGTIPEGDRKGEFDPTLLGDKYLKLYIQVLDLFERRAYGNPANKSDVDVNTTTNVLAVVADLKKQIGKSE